MFVFTTGRTVDRATETHGECMPADRISSNTEGEQQMSKERNTKKEDKKKPAMTPKERKAAKKAKKQATKSKHR